MLRNEDLISRRLRAESYECVNASATAYEYDSDTSWAVVKFYFQPFKSIRLNRMAPAFGWTVEDTSRAERRVQSRGKWMGCVVIIPLETIWHLPCVVCKIPQAKQTDFWSCLGDYKGT